MVHQLVSKTNASEELYDLLDLIRNAERYQEHLDALAKQEQRYLEVVEAKTTLEEVDALRADAAKELAEAAAKLATAELEAARIISDAEKERDIVVGNATKALEQLRTMISDSKEEFKALDAELKSLRVQHADERDAVATAKAEAELLRKEAEAELSAVLAKREQLEKTLNDIR